MEQLNILIYGAGTVGIFFGGKLSKAGFNVTFVDILSQINYNLEDRFRQNIVGSFSFKCLCPLFVFYLAK